MAAENKKFITDGEYDIPEEANEAVSKGMFRIVELKKGLEEKEAMIPEAQEAESQELLLSCTGPVEEAAGQDPDRAKGYLEAGYRESLKELRRASAMLAKAHGQGECDLYMERLERASEDARRIYEDAKKMGIELSEKRQGLLGRGAEKAAEVLKAAEAKALSLGAGALAAIGMDAKSRNGRAEAREKDGDIKAMEEYSGTGSLSARMLKAFHKKAAEAMHSAAQALAGLHERLAAAKEADDALRRAKEKADAEVRAAAEARKEAVAGIFRGPRRDAPEAADGAAQEKPRGFFSKIFGRNGAQEKADAAAAEKAPGKKTLLGIAHSAAGRAAEWLAGKAAEFYGKAAADIDRIIEANDERVAQAYGLVVPETEKDGGIISISDARADAELVDAAMSLDDRLSGLNIEFMKEVESLRAGQGRAEGLQNHLRGDSGSR